MYLALGVPRGKNKGLNLNLNGWISFQPAGGLLIGNIKSRNIMFGLQSVYAQLNQGLINISTIISTQNSYRNETFKKSLL